MRHEATEHHPNSISYSRAIARQLGLQEKDIWRLLTGTRLTINRFIYDDAPISNADQEQIFRNTMAISANQSFGLQLGNSLTPPTHGTMGYLANCSPTLLTALEDFSKFLPTRVGFGRLEIDIDDAGIHCVMRVLYKDETLYRVIAEAFSLSLIILIEYVLGTKLTNANLYFSFAKPAYWDRYAEHIHCPIHFDADSNRLELPGEFKNIANVSSDFHTYQLYKLQCQKQLSELDSERR